jgi:putative transcriptional regulator
MSKVNHTGKLLIAKPSLLGDYTFNRVVILLTDYNETGTVGFVLNKPMDISLKDIIDAIDVDFTVYNGGPVERSNLFFVHCLPELIPNSIAIADNLYWGGDFETVKSLVNNNQIPPNSIRFFLGYSGWDIDQLESELKQDSWELLANKFPNILEASTSNIWKEFIKRLGKKYALWANAPSDPSLN